MIVINTKLDAGIYESHGGGRTIAHHIFTTGPRNLIKAIKTLGEHRRDMIASYGNIGCGSSWLEIDGRRTDQYDLDEVIMEYPPEISTETPTARAKQLLKEVSAYA